MNTSHLFSGTAETGTSDLDYLLAGDAEKASTRAHERGLPLMQLPVAAIAPDPHQLRQIEGLEELRRQAAADDSASNTLLANLQTLGQSIREHGQIQPVIVYRDSDPAQPEITHRLLHGQRRWTASILAGLPSIWAVEVPRPSETERLQRQFDENEQREDFTDIERAWAVQALRAALRAERGDEGSWAEVEARLRLSESRRRDLLRLLRLSPQAQQIALQRRWSEWTLRPLHMAVSAGEIDVHMATDIMRGLIGRAEVTAPVVAAAVAEARAHLAGLLGTASTPTMPDQARTMPRAALVARLQKAHSSMDHVRRQAQDGIDEPTRMALLHEAIALMQSLEQLVETLSGSLDAPA